MNHNSGLDDVVLNTYAYKLFYPLFNELNL